jgi:CubicO group peptidase (beta-lactamase class C family)
MKGRKITTVLVWVLVLILLAGNALPVLAKETGKSETVQGTTPSGISFSQMENKIDEYVKAYIGKTSPGLAIAVVSGGKVVFSKGYGYADVENKKTIDPEKTVFEWGSISKVFTWVSVMQLVEQNKIDLDADISKYIPQHVYKEMGYNQKITMRDLMNHAAGFGDYAFDVLSYTPAFSSLEKSILANHPKQFYKVGTASGYSNYSTMLAGYIVQCVSGQDFLEYEQEHIFNKINMDHTFQLITGNEKEQLMKQKAKGYCPDGRGGFVKGKDSYCLVPPAGALNGTVIDLAKFANAVMSKNNDSLLFSGNNTLTQMLTPSYDEKGTMKGTYHGFMKLGGVDLTLGHGGNTAYFSSGFSFAPEDDFAVCILANATNEMNMVFGLQDLLMGKAKIKDTAQNMPSANELAGSYVPVERQEGNFVDFAKYLSLYNIIAVDDNTIKLQYAGYNATYKQTADYYYELTDSTLPLFNNFYPNIKFVVQNGKVDQIVVGNGMDLTSLPINRTMLVLNISIFALVICVLFFIIAPIVLFVKFKKKKQPAEEKKIRFMYFLISLVGFCLVVNNLGIATVMISIVYLPFRGFVPFLTLNYIFSVLAAILGIRTYRLMKAVKLDKKTLVQFWLVAVLLIVLVALLINWNFFVIYF